MGTEIVEIVEIAAPTINTWLMAGKTAGFVFLAFIAVVVLVGILAKTGVLNKFFDLKIQKLGLSTGFNKEVLKEFRDALARLFENDKNTKDQIAALEERINKNTEAIREVKTEVTETKIESLKKSIFNKDLYLIDRMAAGIRYLLEGYNSEAGNYLLNQLCFEDLMVWNGLCKELKASQYWRSERDRPEDWKAESPKRAKGNQNGTVVAA